MRFIPYPTAAGIMIEMDVADIPKLANMKKIEPYTKFNCKTYAKIYPGSSQAAWSNTFQPVNAFLGQQSKATNEAIGMTLLMVHADLADMSKDLSSASTEIVKKMRVIGERLNELDKSIDLCGKIKKYVMSSVPVGDFKNAGQLSQHSPEFTLYQNEIEDLTVMAVLSKLLTPVMGTAIRVFMVRNDIENVLKESYTYTLMQSMIQRRYPELIAKLSNYLAHIMIKAYTASDTTTMTGVSIQALQLTIVPTVFVRSFVNVDLFYRNGRGNLAKFLCSVARSAGSNSTLNASHKGVYRIRDPLKFQSGEQGNISQAEIDAAISETPLDTIPLASTYVDALVEQQMAHWNLDTEAYKEMVTFYTRNRMSFNTMTRSLLCGYFGDDLGGGNSVKLLGAAALVKLIPVLQLLAFGHELPTLGHLMSSRTDATPRTTKDDIRTFLSVNFRSNFAHTNCRENFSISGVHHWDRGVQTIVEELVTNTFFFNTANVIWEHGDVPNLNGHELPLSKELGVEFATFVDNFIM